MKDGGTSQMILDAGQKEIGPIVCPTCSMVYFKGDPVDEAQHDKHHMRAVKEIKFPGWKVIRVVQEYPETLGSVVLILPSDLKCKGVSKKLDEVYQAMACDLGDLEITPFYAHHLKVFLYIENKKVCGCCMTEPIEEGNRILMTDNDSVDASERRPWRCNEQSEPAAVGISRLWIPVENRRKGIATKLVDCVRQWFNYGILIPKTKVAFSDPTPDGFNFFQKYMGSSTFLVYKYKA
ncbi:unnamed protein product [Lymnaea stagnalis]|uniref:N-acetyltransferase ESCO1 n=1 Tax=Lymnaea stagnalis TaxID=6523 RepID=A0AAV2I113_LYMST